MFIFAENAPFYYAHGLSILPLYEREKRPIPRSWSRYADTLPTPEEVNSWINSYPKGNIGLALGKQSGVIMIDIDTDDERLLEAILSVLPPSPWHRRGKKGVMMAYKWSPISTFRIKQATGEMIVECLSSGTQCVLPPSIHPETRAAYTSDTHLCEVLDKLNYLPEDIEEQLRHALLHLKVPLSHSGSSKITEYVSSGSRDTTLTELAGLFAFAVMRGERTLKQAIGMLHAYHEEYVENVSGDEIDINKHVANLIKFLHRDVQEKKKVLPKGWDDGYTPEELSNLGVTVGKEETAWSVEETRDYLLMQFEAAGAENHKERAKAVEYVLHKLSNTPDMNRLDEDRILTYIVAASGLDLKLSSLRARLKELRTGTVKGTDHSEIARALKRDLEQYNVVRYDQNEFWKWGGSHWVILDRQYIRAKIAENYGHLEACRKYSDISGILNVLSFTLDQGIRRVEVTGVNFANGFLTEDLKLLPHNPEYGLRYTLPFRYIPEKAGQFPLFEEFLNRSWGLESDCEDRISALQEAFCVTLFGLGPRYQRAILLQGAPKTGKTQLLRIVESLVPAEGKCTVPPEVWGDKFMPAQMAGKILNVVGEMSENQLINGQTFKDIIDGSERSGQHKNQQIFQFRPYVTHWFASNHFPRSTDTSGGFIRRWLVLNFANPVPESERKVDIGNAIVCSEREAIVAWAVSALPRLLRRNEYTIPASHRTLLNEIANMNNSVRFFLTEGKKVQFNVPQGEILEEKLFTAYWSFMMSNGGGMKPVSSTKFRQMLRELALEFNFQLAMKPNSGGGVNAYVLGVSLH